jgi:hypothetical protein
MCIPSVASKPQAASRKWLRSAQRARRFALGLHHAEGFSANMAVMSGHSPSAAVAGRAREGAWTLGARAISMTKWVSYNSKQSDTQQHLFDTHYP